ncbi:HIT family hydrolase, diadenosine tetraphosphate hydrolase [Frankia sp. EI5c]|uniref:HIT family protein n=1 Tax=Frankia sp. EI5c TaxID=683316 RepID=UPI0007C391FE|nr:HIT family protein [Frankia sp. EI5c]OAA25756.1 HIT family hydrolase, diadenosine tetraphosphate hydrolase [Frankia sp. EI5c]
MGDNEVSSTDSCWSCDQNTQWAGLLPRERIHLGDGWRVAHAIRCALPGWLVVVARRHITTVAELSQAEAAELGLLCTQVSRALTEVTGCTRTYVAAFSEAAGFTHLHVHIIPRAADLPAEEHGPAIFHHLRRPESEWVPADVMDELARALSARLASQL